MADLVTKAMLKDIFGVESLDGVNPDIEVRYRSELKVALDVHEFGTLDAIASTLDSGNYPLYDINNDRLRRSETSRDTTIYGRKLSITDTMAMDAYNRESTHFRPGYVKINDMCISANNVAKLIASRFSQRGESGNKFEEIGHITIKREHFVTFSYIHSKNMTLISACLRRIIFDELNFDDYNSIDRDSSYNSIETISCKRLVRSDQTIEPSGNKLLFRDRFTQWTLLAINTSIFISSIVASVLGEFKNSPLLKSYSSAGAAFLVLVLTTFAKLLLSGWSFENMVIGKRETRSLSELFESYTQFTRTDDVTESRRKILRRIAELDKNREIETSGLNSCWLYNSTLAGGFNMNCDVSVEDLLYIGYTLVVSDSVYKVSGSVYVDRACHLINASGQEACIRYFDKGVLHANNWVQPGRSLLCSTMRTHDLLSENYSAHVLLGLKIGTGYQSNKDYRDRLNSGDEGRYIQVTDINDSRSREDDVWPDQNQQKKDGQEVEIIKISTGAARVKKKNKKNKARTSTANTKDGNVESQAGKPDTEKVEESRERESVQCTVPNAHIDKSTETDTTKKQAETKPPVSKSNVSGTIQGGNTDNKNCDPNMTDHVLAGGNNNGNKLGCPIEGPQHNKAVATVTTARRVTNGVQ